MKESIWEVTSIGKSRYTLDDLLQLLSKNKINIEDSWMEETLEN